MRNMNEFFFVLFQEVIYNFWDVSTKIKANISRPIWHDNRKWHAKICELYLIATYDLTWYTQHVLHLPSLPWYT